MQILNLKNSREKLNLTQINLAEILKVDNSTISGWETGRDTIPLEKLVKYANIYHYSLDYLFGLSNINSFSINYVIDLETIGKKLKKIRLDNHYTLEKVAQKLNTTKSTIWAYENGEHLISTTFLYALTKIFNSFSIDDLFSKDNENIKEV